MGLFAIAASFPAPARSQLPPAELHLQCTTSNGETAKQSRSALGLRVRRMCHRTVGSLCREWKFEANVSIGTEDASAQPDAHGFVAFADLYASRVCKAPEEADEYEFEIETAAAPLAGAPCAETSEQLTVAALRLDFGSATRLGPGVAGTSAAVSIELYGQNEAGDESCEAVNWDKQSAHFGTIRLRTGSTWISRFAISNRSRCGSSACPNIPLMRVCAVRGAVAKASFTLPNIGHLTMLRVSHDGSWNEGRHAPGFPFPPAHSAQVR